MSASARVVHRGGLVAAGRQRQRPQRLDLDDAAHPVLGRRLGEQPVQQRQRLTGAVLREQHPRQYQILQLVRVAGLVLGAEAVLLGPADGRGDVALG